MFQPSIIVPNLSQVKSAVYDFGMPGGGGNPPKLTISNARDKAVMAKVLNWISQAKYDGVDTTDFVPPIGPAHFVINLQDGSWIRIAPVLKGTVVRPVPVALRYMGLPHRMKCNIRPLITNQLIFDLGLFTNGF